MFALANICIFAQDSPHLKKDSSATPVLDKTEQLVDKYGAKIADAFMVSIDKATPFVKSTFASLVYLQIGRGIAYLIPTLLFLLFVFLLIKEYNLLDAVLKSDKIPNYLNGNRGPLHEDNINPKILICVLFSIVFCVASIFTIGAALEHLFAPQWFAVKDIIDMFKK